MADNAQIDVNFLRGTLEGEIHCDARDEPEGARCYVIRVPACAVPRAQAFIDDLLCGRYPSGVCTKADDVSSHLAALRRLIEQMR